MDAGTRNTQKIIIFDWFPETVKLKAAMILLALEGDTLVAKSYLNNHQVGQFTASKWDSLITLDFSSMEEEVGVLTSECTG